MRTPTSLIVLILLLQSPAFVEAAEKRIIGTITAVDANNRSITVDAVNFDSGHEIEPVTVDVIRKTKITVQGEWARFANIMVGQSANVTFDDKLEAATVIAIRESLARDEKKTAEDMKTLQGNWICIAEEEATAGVIDTETVRERNRRVTISNNNFTMRRTLDGKRGTFAGKFDIDAVTGHFNFIGTHANGDASEWIGVYEIKNDTWRVRFTFKTPTEAVRPAELDERERSKSRMYTFKRDFD